MIRIAGLCKSYREGAGERRVFHDFNARVGAGERLALVGRSGCGKSTLLNLISGMDRPDAGTIHVNDTEISALDERGATLFRRRHVGFVFQFFNLIPTLTVTENLLLPLELNGQDLRRGRQDAAALLEAVGLADRGQSYPDRLSGGEQQRIAIARALIHRPRLLLADEPTGTLDARNGDQVLALLEAVSRERQLTTVLVTHSPEVAARMDRTLDLSRSPGAERTAAP
ncbi:ABC transporter ATP-binding protein [Methylonatrum kenyense]|uniref:ABC transporter ATP-binding protein n=1 Tax=Methylonatrum kenyense TaxID=455253 RepID=UPI0020C031F1|nr:ABC transporter ATP-binding protein [Methylonatrum kenyense]MCK8516323.1 ABC transporter ATP-binding protein [Methylonatrum kenyense]